MNFAEAFALLLAGKKVRRADWNRVAYVERALADFGDGSAVCVRIVMRGGRINTYTPSQCDMTNIDWYEVA